MSEKEGWFTRKRKELMNNKSIAEFYDEGRFTSLTHTHIGWQHREVDRVTETSLHLLYEASGMTVREVEDWIESLAAICDYIGNNYKALAKLIRARKL